ncbi:sodium/glutamate symporter [Bacillaceae bacterium IKA-2]|nr:sodium/glutamate symporter [Bacillaceae bacterium IKA-2]
MEFTPWALFIDVGIVSFLLIIGTLLRAKVKFVQSLFLPASMIAGFLGLLLGPSGINILPFSDQIASYPGVLIAVIFGAIPIGAVKVPWKKLAGRVRNMWSYSMLLTTLMWGGGALFGLAVLGFIFTDLHVGFGLILGAGFLGGHGTAAALGQGFAIQGWDEALTLGMTSATIGMIVAVLGGLFLIKKSTKKGHTSFISSFEDLPQELRTGLVDRNNRNVLGEDTISPISIDPLIFHVALVSMVVAGAYFITNFGNSLFPQIAIPLFSIAFLLGLFLQFVMRKTNSDDYVDQRVITRISGGATDLLVAFGIIWAYLIFRFVAPRIFDTYWFERAIFGWGWSTGTVAMGLALLRIVDPDLKSKTLDDYAISYLGMVPPEMLIITMAPILFSIGLPWVFPAVLLLTAITIILVFKKKGWWVSEDPFNRTQSDKKSA